MQRRYNNILSNLISNVDTPPTDDTNTLRHFPAELVLLIAECLDTVDFLSFRATYRWHYYLVKAILPKAVEDTVLDPRPCPIGPGTSLPDSITYYRQRDGLTYASTATDFDNSLKSRSSVAAWANNSRPLYCAAIVWTGIRHRASQWKSARRVHTSGSVLESKPRCTSVFTAPSRSERSWLPYAVVPHRCTQILLTTFPRNVSCARSQGAPCFRSEAGSLTYSNSSALFYSTYWK